MIKKRKALVIGATGLVGSHLVGQLLDSDDFRAVKIFVRRKTALEHRKLEEYVVDFDSIEEWENLLTGDVLFSTLGTTLRKAGSKEAQYKVDYSYQYEVAKTAAQNSVKSYALVLRTKRILPAFTNTHGIKFMRWQIRGTTVLHYPSDGFEPSDG